MRDQHPLDRLWRSLTSLGRDLGVASRRLRATPLFTTFAILSLGLGVGVTTAAYSAMYALGARPSGVRDEGRVVLVTATNSRSGTAAARMSWADYQDLTAQQRSASDLVAWTEMSGVLVGQASSVRVGVEGVTGRYFSALGVRPAIGRAIVPDDDRPDAPAVMVLSDLVWRRQFGANPAIVGTTVRFAQQTLQIVGVMPASFRSPTSQIVSEVLAWVPLAYAQRSGFRRDATFDPVRRDARWLSVAGRLRPDATAEGTNREIATIGLRLDDTATLPMMPSAPGQPAIPAMRAWAATPLDEITNIFDFEAMRVAVGLPFVVLLIACTNLANLVLSRATSRRHEIAIRGALGASRWRLLQEHLAETTLIAAAGGLLGVLVAHGLLTWSVSALREPMETFQPGLILAWHLEPVVFGAAAAGALVSVLIAGLVPAVQTTRVNVGRALTVGDPTSAMPRWRWRSNLVALQLGVSTGLFLITVVCVRFLVIDGPARDRRQPELRNLAVASVLFDRGYDPVRLDDTSARIVEQARRLPNAAAASASTGLPVDARGVLGPRSVVQITAADRPFPSRPTPQNLAAVVAATPGLPGSMALELLSGRFVEDADRGHGVTIDARVANNLFGSTNVVGREVRVRRESTGAATIETESTLTIVGVLPAPPASGRQSDRRLGVLFVPFVERTAWDARLSSLIVFAVRATSGDATGHVTTLRTVIRHVDQDLAVSGAARGDIAVGGEVGVLAPFFAAGFGLLAVLSLALAMAGLYGVLSHVIARRTREMGLRFALGASPRRILALVLRQGLRPVIEGLLIGLGVALVLRQLLQVSMTGTLSTVNIATFALAAGPLAAAGVLAAYLPARRASRVDPNVALRNL